LYVLRRHSVAEAAAAPLYVPGGAVSHTDAPRAAKVPAGQGAHAAAALAPGDALAEPEGHDRHAAKVCPPTGL
jgi:hypothetical protein